MINIIKNNIIDLPTNPSLNYYWCSGFMISGFFITQMITGIMLSFFYVGDVNLSFACVSGLTNDGFFTWVLRYFHIWGASFIFILYCVHMGRALYYSSYSKVVVWNIGFLLYLVMMVEAFLGYILPWHQMSYWAATVLTSVVQSLPVIGDKLYIFIVGGYSVTNVTLIRVFSAHIILAFLITGLILLHLYYLHQTGSNNNLFVYNGYTDSVYFHNYYSNKDGFLMCVFFFFFMYMMLTSPDLVLDPEAYIIADPLVTPIAIKPEWYFLAYYAMLRSVNSKIGGLLLVIVFLIVLWIPTNNHNCGYSLYRQVNFWSFVSLLLLLTYLGACHPEPPFIVISQISSVLSVFLLFIFKFTNSTNKC